MSNYLEKDCSLLVKVGAGIAADWVSVKESKEGYQHWQSFTALNLLQNFCLWDVGPSRYMFIIDTCFITIQNLIQCPAFYLTDLGITAGHHLWFSHVHSQLYRQGIVVMFGTTKTVASSVRRSQFCLVWWLRSLYIVMLSLWLWLLIVLFDL